MDQFHVYQLSYNTEPEGLHESKMAFTSMEQVYFRFMKKV